ncbi:MAG TPA: ABC transporter substrate-binding protein [Solirubrobacteraceae bacterium]|nr:ABC transporter substrate-binding protein [Solirubrobacteraceae bacterium]
MLATAALAPTVAPAAAQATTVRVPFPRDPGTLTPLTFALGYPLLALVYDTITWRDARGLPRPWLARSVQALEGGRRVVVRLRDDLHWHDGRALTAGDVAFTYDFIRARRHPRFAPQLHALASVRARDARTVEFGLRHPSIGFADQPLADVPILPAHVWRGVGSGLRAPAGAPVGSGPYRLAGRRGDGGVQLAAVRDYFRGRPAVDRVDVPVIPEATDMLAALRRGNADALPFTLTPEQVARVASVSVRIARGPLYLGTMLMFNVRRPPFDRAEVRRTIAAALDRRRIARAAGDGLPATTGFLHPQSRWAPPPTTLVPPRPGRSLAALGLPPVRELAPAHDRVRREAGRQVVLALRRAGARARLAVLSRARLGRAVGEGGDGAPSFDVAIWSIPALASFDPDYLGALFGERGGGVLNRSGYRSAAFDRLAAQVAAAPTVGSRRHAVSALLAQLERDAPAVPLLFSEGAFAYDSTSPVDWTFVAGSGILDKRSLLRPARERGAFAGPSPPGAGDDGGDLRLLTVLGGGMLAVALLLGGAAALGRRS